MLQRDCSEKFWKLQMGREDIEVFGNFYETDMATLLKGMVILFGNYNYIFIGVQ